MLLRQQLWSEYFVAYISLVFHPKIWVELGVKFSFKVQIRGNFNEAVIGKNEFVSRLQIKSTRETACAELYCRQTVMSAQRKTNLGT